MTKKFWIVAAVIFCVGIISWVFWGPLNTGKKMMPSESIATHSAIPSQSSSAGTASAALSPAQRVSVSNTNIDSQISTFENAIAKRTPAEKEYLSALNVRFFGLLNYTSPEELSWKLERGFPSIEEALMLRERPRPVNLSDAEMKALDSKAMARYLFHRAISISQEQSFAKEDSIFVYLDSSRLLNKMDTPMPAFLQASTINPADPFAAGRFSKAATLAAVFGDVTLADEIGARFHNVNESIVQSVAGASDAASAQARAQTPICGVDRYTGNPRTVEQSRQLRLTRPCKQ